MLQMQKRSRNISTYEVCIVGTCEHLKYSSVQCGTFLAVEQCRGHGPGVQGHTDSPRPSPGHGSDVRPVPSARARSGAQLVTVHWRLRLEFCVYVSSSIMNRVSYDGRYLLKDESLFNI